MGADDPIFIILILLLAGYFLRMWIGDYRDYGRGKPHPKALPGATPAPGKALWIAAAGALVILLVETGGEYALGTSAEQSDIKAIALLAFMAAAFTEELIMRGFLVVGNSGKTALVVSIIVFSGFFAMAHPFLWSYESVVENGDKIFRWTFNIKGLWSTVCVFSLSVWLYTVRFLPNNPKRSLLPCIAGHLTKNMGVFVIKLIQGHVVGWW